MGNSTDVLGGKNMNTKIEKIEVNVVNLEITVEAQKFSEAMVKAYKKNASKYTVQGFRKGKAPMNLIKKLYGEGVFYDDAINFCCEDTYPIAIKENNIRPVDYPEIDIVEIGEGKDFVYTAKVTVYPEVELGEYKAVEVKKVEYSTSEEDVENQLKAMAERNARIEEKTEGKVENGNVATIDFKGFIEGVAFEGGEGKDYDLEIGSHSFIGDFEEQLIGMAAGESKNVSVSFPENYGKEELNGKPAVFEVTVKAIKEKLLPELDDEFAKEASEFDTLEELKADIKNKMVESNELKAKREMEEAVVDTVCANAKAEIPQVMIEKEIEAMMKDFEMRLSYQGLDLKSYYQFTNSSEELLKESMKDAAEKRVKSELVLSKIGEVENFEATEEEIAAKAEEMAKHYGGKDLEKTKDLLISLQSEVIKGEIKTEKVVKMLVDNAKFLA